MANVNGNNIDDLFRQASDQYPLRTDGSDWNRLASALDANHSLVSPQGDEQEGKRKRRRVLLWLLLPLIAVGFGYYVWHNPAARKVSVATDHSVVAATPTNDAGQAKLLTEPSSGTAAKAVPAEKVAGGVNSGTAGNGGESAKTGVNENVVRENGVRGAVVSGNGATGNGVRRNVVTGNGASGNVASGNEVMGNRVVEHGGSPMNGRVSGANGKEISERNEIVKTGKAVAGINDANGTGVAGTKNRRGRQGDGRRDVTMIRTDNDGKSADGAEGELVLSYSKVNGPGPMTKGDIPIPVDVMAKANGNSAQEGHGQEGKVTKSAVSKKNTMATRKHSIYIGLLGAPDLSTIQFQTVRSTGTTFGILGGFTLNKKWSLETGVYLDKKKYYTEGRYFNTEKIPALNYPYVDLNDVNGSCNMVEIPINLRYNLSSGQHHTFFATTGLSTYLMSQEQYQYQITWSGMPQTSAVFTYKTPYHYLFSIVDLSIGYEQKLGKIGNLRIEPYLRVPLSGIGTGNLSILSAGLNLGITRRIW